MNKKISSLLFTFMLLSITLCDDECSLPDYQKTDCGFSGIDQNGCEQRNCCWVPAGEGSSTPWCFNKSSPDNTCLNFNLSAPSDMGFNQDFKKKMLNNFVSQLNWEGKGAVVAANDPNTPGGSYVYHWMRDGGLSIHTYLDINHNSYHKTKDIVRAYVGWVKNAQSQQDDNVDVRTEPKFYIETGKPYDGGWCRPQNDGPAIRAKALTQWANVLIAQGLDDEVRNDVWPLIKFDLEWVTQNWKQEGCDLWEEVRSNDFYFVRMAYVNSLNLASDLANHMGESGLANTYSSVKQDIRNTLANHWTGEYIYESSNRKIDGAVMQALATFGGEWQTASDDKVAKTIKVYNTTFCNQYKINQDDNKNRVPGVLYGRYPNDSYAGGNPWPILTASLAEVFYLASDEISENVSYEFTEKFKAYQELLNVKGNTLDLAESLRDAGDAVMSRLWKYLKNDDGRVDEQIDKNNGKQASAKGLTWSYANILHALHVRDKLNVKLIDKRGE